MLFQVLEVTYKSCSMKYNTDHYSVFSFQNFQFLKHVKKTCINNYTGHKT